MAKIDLKKWLSNPPTFYKCPLCPNEVTYLGDKGMCLECESAGISNWAMKPSAVNLTIVPDNKSRAIPEDVDVMEDYSQEMNDL